MSLTQEKITSLGKLTALRHSENLSIDSVLNSFESLSQLDVDLHMPFSRSGNDDLLLRDDRVKASLASSEALLDCSHQRVIANQISLGSIMHGE